MITLLMLAALGANAPLANEAQSAALDDREQIVVTGTRTPRTLREAPVRTDVIGPAVLERAAPRSLADALDFLVGARSESNCQNCNTTEIQLLGLPGAYNQILLDGLPMVSGVAAVYGVEQIPAVLVDRIEVVKGGASALYGPGAVAGVVNVIPMRPERDGIRSTADVQFVRGRASVLGSLLGSKTFDGGFINAYAQAEYSPDVDLNDDGYSELARRKLSTVGVRGEWLPGTETTIAVDYQFTAERRRGGNHLDRPAYLANIAEQIDSDVHRGSISIAQQLGQDTKLVGSYAISRLDRRSFYGGLGDVETNPGDAGFDAAELASAIGQSRRQYGSTDDTLHFGELRLETITGAHALLGGVQYRAEQVRDLGKDVTGATLATLVDDGFDTVGAFVQDEWALNEGLRLILGARVDKSSRIDTLIVSPRIGLWASPSASLVLRANYSTGFRAPEVFSEDVHVDILGAEPVRVINASGLKAERADSFALGFDWRPTWHDGALTLDGQFYFTALRDTFFLGEIERAASGALYRTRDNAGGSRVAGGELNIAYRFSPSLNATIGGAYVHTRYDDPQTIFGDGADALTTRRFLKTPRLSAVAQIVWRASPSFDAFLAARYTGRMDVLNNRLGAVRRTDDFLVLDLTGTRHIPFGDGAREVDVTFGIKNLTNVRQRDLESGATRDSTYVYGPRLPRAFFARINARF